MNSDKELGAFQARLLELLAEDLSPEEIQKRLRADPRAAQFRKYLAGFEPCMLETASVLVKKWGIRSGTGDG